VSDGPVVEIETPLLVMRADVANPLVRATTEIMGWPRSRLVAVHRHLDLVGSSAGLVIADTLSDVQSDVPMRPRWLVCVIGLGYQVDMSAWTPYVVQPELRFVPNEEAEGGGVWQQLDTMVVMVRGVGGT
jgi:hypothetical protein